MRSQLPGTSSRYGDFGANNIVIVPTVSFTDKHQTTPGTGNVSSVQITKTASTTKTVTAVTVHTNQIKPTPMNLDETKPAKLKKIQTNSQSQKFPTEEINKNTANTEDLNKTKKASWASNYLQSIGHNNIKPIKINLTRSKLQKIETVTTKSTDSNIAQPTLIRNSTSYDYPNKKIIGEHIAIGNNPQLGVSFIKAPVVPSIDKATSSVKSKIVLDSVYTKNNNHTTNIAPPYSNLFVKDNGQAKYCYNDGKHEIDILDAIKSKIHWESIQHNTRKMPTHKDMCEEFIKEISIKPSTSERKRDYPKSTTKSKKDLDKHSKKPSASKLEAKVKTLDKPDKKIIKETLKTIKKKTSDKDKAKKLKPSLVDKPEKKEKKTEKEKIQYKKQQKIKPIIDGNDFDFLTKKIVPKATEKKPDFLTKQTVPKATEKKPKTDDLDFARKKLKRVRTISEEPPHNSNSEKCVRSPVKSIVRKTEKFTTQGNSPKRQRLEIDEGFDLRSKLSRANQRINRKQMENDKSTNAKPQKNLKVSVENQNTVKTKSPKKSNVLKYKTKKSRKLKLIINVVCEESDDESSSSDSNMNEATPTQNMDLSFLDDFNVDEIVDSLKHSPKHKMKSPLQNENKLEDCSQMPAEPQLKLATILNMLQANSETNKLKKTVKAEYNTQETTTSNSSIGSSQAHPNSMSDHKTEEYVMNKIKKEENDFNDNKNATQALIKILSQTKSQLDQPKTAPLVDESLVVKCGSQVLDSNMSFINISQETMCSEDTDMLDIDESVIINERDISIIDLTNDTLLPASSEIHTDSIEAIQNFIQSQMQDINVNSKNAEKDENENLPNLKPVNNNSELVSSNHLNKNPNDENKNSNANNEYIDVKIETNTLGNNHDVLIDLTEESLNDGIHEVMGLNNGNTEKTVENEVNLKQEIHLVPLPNVEEQIINNKSENDKMTIKVIDEKSTKLVENISLTINDRLGDTSIKTKEPAANKSIIVNNNNDTEKIKNEKKINNIEYEKNLPESNEVDNKPAENISVIANNNNDTVKKWIEANIKNTDKAKENVKNIPETVGNKSVKENLDMNKAFESTTAKPAKETSVIAHNNNDTVKKWIEANIKNTDEAKENVKNIPVTVGNKSVKENQDMNKAFESTTAKPAKVIAHNNNDTVKKWIEANIKNTDEAKENVKNIPVTVGNKSVKENLDMKKAFETTTVKKILKNIVDSVCDNNNELENTAYTDKTQNKVMKTANETISELETVPNSNNVTVEKKAVPGKILSCQRNALTMLLEERMLNYLHKEIKVIQHIHLGKFSNIYSCKDSTTGEMYAAKILNNPNDRLTQGIQKEQMIRQFQQDIPRENVNTVYLIDGFGIERYWCFLTEYYPKNLLQVFKNQTKPFHIDLVQDLTRQLISAVLVLRNNDIVHSDIKPSHILMNTTHDRLKLCGFDDAYCGNNVYPLPNFGTSFYRAPEIILGFRASYSIDVWASALVIYQMATNQRLFTGVYNNDILFQQMCTFGSLTRDMVEASPFKNQHFQGNVFMRRVGYRGQDAVLHVQFYKTIHLQRLLKNAYNKHWLTKDIIQRNSDMNKVNALSKLLEQMLLLDPRFRIAIEFVRADPFIY